MSFQPQHRGDRWHVVDTEAGVELCPVFDHEITAMEVAAKVNDRHPFFSHIPTTNLGDPYPRLGHPWHPVMNLLSSPTD